MDLSNYLGDTRKKCFRPTDCLQAEIFNKKNHNGREAAAGSSESSTYVGRRWLQTDDKATFSHSLLRVLDSICHLIYQESI